MNDEEWKPIEGFEGYEVSSHGRVRSYWKHIGNPGRNGAHTELTTDIQKNLKSRLTGRGYYYVGLKKHKKQVNLVIHRIVALTFICNANNLPQVDHIDGNKLNNHVSNLRWCSRSQNQQNRIIPSNNSSNIKGIGFHKTNKKWYAHWVENGDQRQKYFKNKEDAVAHRQKMVELHYDQDFYKEF
jgi:hypothetical protein